MYELCLQLFWKIDLVNKAKNYIFPKEQNMINQLKVDYLTYLITENINSSLVSVQAWWTQEIFQIIEIFQTLISQRISQNIATSNKLVISTFILPLVQGSI